MRKEEIRMRKIYSQTHRQALKKDWTNKFNQELKIIARSNQNLILVIYGKQGSGKSYVLLFIAEKFLSFFQPPMKLTVDDCHFSNIDLLESIEKKKGHPGLDIKDEQIQTVGMGSQAERMALENVIMTVRGQKQSIFFSAPHFVSVDCHYTLKTWEMGALEPWDWNKPIEQQWVFTKSLIYSSDGDLLGYIVTKTPKDMELLKKYEEKKDQFITRTRAQGGSMRYMYILRKAKELMNNPEFLEDFNSATNKKLKAFFCTKHMGSSMLTIAETGILVDYIQNQMKRAPKPKKLKLNIKRKT